MTKVKILLVGIVLIACSTKSASEYPTSNMMADLTAVAAGNGSTSVSATLRDPSSSLTFLQLTADDEFIASQGADSQEMKEVSLFGLVTYGAKFNKDAADTEFHVKLTRKMDSGAPDSVARLPKPFTMGTLPKNEFSRAADAIVVAWTSETSTDRMAIEAAGGCIDSLKSNLATGATSYTIDVGVLKKRAPANADETVPDDCDVTVSVTRQRDGTVDKAFKGGSFVASQIRTVSFKSKP